MFMYTYNYTCRDIYVILMYYRNVDSISVDSSISSIVMNIIIIMNANRITNAHTHVFIIIIIISSSSSSIITIMYYVLLSLLLGLVVPLHALLWAVARWQVMGQTKFGHFDYVWILVICT